MWLVEGEPWRSLISAWIMGRERDIGCRHGIRRHSTGFAGTKQAVAPSVHCRACYLATLAALHSKKAPPGM